MNQILSFFNTFDLIVSDICGVLHDHNTAIPGVLTTLKACDRPFIFISNASASHDAIDKKFTALTGEPLADFGSIYSSYDYLSFAIEVGEIPDIRKSPSYFLYDSPLPDWPGPVAHSLQEAEYVVLASLGEDSTLPPSFDECSQALAANKPLICVNSDCFIRSHYSQIIRPGYLAQQYQQKGGEVFFMGKPSPNLYKFAFQSLNFQPQKVLYIGDNPDTDGLGAKNMGGSFLLTLSGVPSLNWSTELSVRSHAKRIMKSTNLKQFHTSWTIEANQIVSTYHAE